MSFEIRKVLECGGPTPLFEFGRINALTDRGNRTLELLPSSGVGEDGVLRDEVCVEHWIGAGELIRCVGDGSAQIVRIAVEETADDVWSVHGHFVTAARTNSAFRVVLPKDAVAITAARSAIIDAVEIAGESAVIDGRDGGRENGEGAAAVGFHVIEGGCE